MVLEDPLVVRIKWKLNFAEKLFKRILIELISVALMFNSFWTHFNGVVINLFYGLNIIDDKPFTLAKNHISYDKINNII